jgi:hypothetical protein
MSIGLGGAARRLNIHALPQPKPFVIETARLSVIIVPSAWFARSLRTGEWPNRTRVDRVLADQFRFEFLPA